jgi:putative transposase
MKRGFMYMTAIIDVYSRKIVGWSISNSIGSQWCKNVLENAIATHGRPEIINSDQGSQYTSALWTQYVEQQGIQLSMDGKGRALENIWIERFWKSLNYYYMYLNPSTMVLNFMEAFKTTSTTIIKKYIISHCKTPRSI